MSVAPAPSPNLRLQRTRSASPPSPLSRQPLGEEPCQGGSGRRHSVGAPYVLCSAIVLAFLSQKIDGQTLYALGFSGSFATVFALDPATGVSSPVVTTDSASIVGGELAIDPVGRRLFFGGGVPTPSLYTVDLANRTFSKVPLSPCCPALIFGPAAMASTIPMLSHAGLIIFALAIAIVGLRLCSRAWS